MSDIQDEAYSELCKENRRLNKLYRASLELLACQGALITRAADALERVGPYVEQQLIAELRKAAQ